MCEFCGNRDHRLFVEDTTHTPTVETSYATKPTNTVDEIADYLTTGYWEANGGAKRSFSESTGDELSVNLTGLTASAKAVARQALEAWEAVSGLKFVETTSSIVDISFDDTDQRGAYAQSSVYSSGDIYRSWVNIPTWWGANADYYLQTYIHEIGHALGLGHAGLYNGTGTYEDDAEYANDSWQMSIMSYFSQYEATAVDADFAYVYTPQIADIAAIQDLYGVPTNVETGNTTYGDGNSTGRSIMDMDHSYAFTIVDSGGIDTINLGSRSYNQNLSLVVDSFSDLNGKVGNFAIGRGTVIENAITGSGNDTITGNAADNYLQSGSGNDTLIGGAGNDTLVGGSGDDLYYVDASTDRIVENSGEGQDHVEASTSFALRNSSNNIETLTLTGTGDFSGVGNGRKNTITGNSGNNLLNGAWGNDTLIGGAGNDTFKDGAGKDRMIGGTGNDTYYVDHALDQVREQQGEGIDLIKAGMSVALRDLSNHVENLTLTGTGDIDGTGNGRKNVIAGNSGNNLLNGAWGDDTLLGGAGNDTFQDDNGNDQMAGGTGNDTYYIDSLGDRIVETKGNGTDHVISSVSIALRDLSQNLESLTLSGSADIDGTGNGGANVITGNSGNNLLNGAWGDDTLIGGAGNDTLNDDGGNEVLTGGSGADVFVFSGSFGTDTITDFDTTETGEIISLAGVSGISSYDDLVNNHLSEVGGDAIISDGLGNSVMLTGVGIADLTADDFLF
ncbi:M10 family metallopeptidase [Pseudophaeobacter profundi]|uniref:M10 family metallopeptidase n=1 Tax=Pseudophaeobacter profundi TaxID=3034152 RepID=UPI00242D2F62|nr:M10 family metallopeptidase [Pseudophaeobacter profundi]